LAVLILGSIRNGLTLLSVSSDFQQWITGFLLLASVLISEIRVWNIKTLIK
jgi:ribose transport system permease protein